MARSKDFIYGWPIGWASATQALLQSLEHVTAAPHVYR